MGHNGLVVKWKSACRLVVSYPDCVLIECLLCDLPHKRIVSLDFSHTLCCPSEYMYRFCMCCGDLFDFEPYACWGLKHTRHTCT